MLQTEDFMQALEHTWSYILLALSEDKAGQPLLPASHAVRLSHNIAVR